MTDQTTTEKGFWDSLFENLNLFFQKIFSAPEPRAGHYDPSEQQSMLAKLTGPYEGDTYRLQVLEEAVGDRLTKIDTSYYYDKQVNLRKLLQTDPVIKDLCEKAYKNGLQSADITNAKESAYQLHERVKHTPDPVAESFYNGGMAPDRRRGEGR